ncbi:MAG: c-type cytochrome [Acidobacteria bacterium]|nr:c-type cytochrome [Acidobacteriota bacterium]
MKLTYIKHSLIVLALGFSVAFLLPQRTANSQTTPQNEKTIEQTHKDIRSLTGLPDSQLTHIMNYFNASLGVQCTFCHVRENNAMAFDKDHEHKTIAREMIKLVQDINKNNFNGRNEISCFTCHQGRPMPAAMPSFPLPAPMGAGPRPGGAPGAGPASPPPAPTPAPTAEQVWDKYVAAVGGKDAISKLKNSIVKGSFVMNNGQTMELEITSDAGNIHSLLKGQNSEMRGAYTGATGWSKDQRGQREMNRNEIANAKALLENLAVIKLAEPYPKLSLSPRRTKIGDREAFVMRGTRDDKSLTLYFDAETGLLLRKVEVAQSFVGRIPEQVDYEDYRDVDGVKLPMTIKTYSVIGPNNGTRKLTEVKFNQSIDRTIFSAPK